MSARDEFNFVFRPKQADRTAPVQGTRQARIPWEIHETAWRGYAASYSNNQDAERIAERGGFGWGELVGGLWVEIIRLRTLAQQGDGANG